MESISSDLMLDLDDEPPRLKCLFYAEFDSRLGPRIVHQIPDDNPCLMISKETFDSLSGYFITKPELLDKFIKVNTPKLKIMGHPVVIENKKYERNAFIFNLCFVVDNVSHVDCLYEPLVCKMARYLIGLETNCEYLSKSSTKADFKDIMRQMYTELNAKRECAITVNEMTCISLKLMPKVYPPAKKFVSPHDAPVLRRRYTEEDLNRLDVVSQKCLPHLTGFSPINQISDIVQMDKTVVCRCVENLQYHGLVGVLPLFLYTNSYVTTSKLRKLYESDAEFKRKFCSAVALQQPQTQQQSQTQAGSAGVVAATSASNQTQPPKFNDIFRLLSRIQPSLSIKDWCLRHNPRAYNVDERKLIQLSVYNGFVRKLTVYPASLTTRPRFVTTTGGRLRGSKTTTTNDNDHDSESATVTNGETESATSASPNLLDGSRSLEELAALWGQKPSETLQCLENNPDIVLLVK